MEGGGIRPAQKMKTSPVLIGLRSAMGNEDTISRTDYVMIPGFTKTSESHKKLTKK